MPDCLSHVSRTSFWARRLTARARRFGDHPRPLIFDHRQDRRTHGGAWQPGCPRSPREQGYQIPREDRKDPTSRTAIAHCRIEPSDKGFGMSAGQQTWQDHIDAGEAEDSSRAAYNRDEILLLSIQDPKLLPAVLIPGRINSLDEARSVIHQRHRRRKTAIRQGYRSPIEAS